MRLRIFTEPQQGATYDDLLRVAQAAERLGFDAFFRSDHWLSMGGVEGRPGPSDAWITLAGIARETSTIRLGTLVNSATFRIPGPLAIAVANVDQMSNGRVELGLGAGWYDDEHKAYGIPFPPVKERFDILEEQLEIIDGLWRTPDGEKFNFVGSHYTVTDSPAWPKPIQSPPPIIIGGYGPHRTPRLAARFAAEFNMPFPLIDMYTAQVERVKAACVAIDRDPRTMKFTVAQIVVCGSTESEIAHRAKAVNREPDELRKNGLCGTPKEVATKLIEWRNAGAETCYLQILDLADINHLELIASEVMPLL